MLELDFLVTFRYYLYTRTNGFGPVFVHKSRFHSKNAMFRHTEYFFPFENPPRIMNRFPSFLHESLSNRKCYKVTVFVFRHFLFFFEKISDFAQNSRRHKLQESIQSGILSKIADFLEKIKNFEKLRTSLYNIFAY